MVAAAEAGAWAHGAALLAEIAQTVTERGSLALWHLGQSGWVVRAGQQTLVLDPFLQPSGERLRRTWEPPLAPGGLCVDVVFCSHDHVDHLDPFAVRELASANPRARFVVPRAALGRLRESGVADAQIVEGEVDRWLELGNCRFMTVPAAHGDRADPVAECVWEPDPVRGYRFVGFVVDANGVRLYHAGDTTVYPGMVERLAPLEVDLALLPINGRDWFREQRGIIGNTDEREAADLGHTIGADTIVPMHYDMFAGNPGSPGRFVEYCAAQYPAQAFHVPTRCKRWIYVK